MDLKTAVRFLHPAIPRQRGIWADIGAGSGAFTLALDQLLEKGSTIYAVDKSPHLLYGLRLTNCELIVEERDFTRAFQLPPLDGIIMANALHYAKDQIAVLNNLLQSLKPGSSFVLIEYELSRPLSPWIPYPLPFRKFQELAKEVALSPPEELNRMPSAYGHEYMYLAVGYVEVERLRR